MTKEIISVKASVRTGDIGDIKADIAVVGVFSDEKKQSAIVGKLDKKLGGDIEQLMKIGDFMGREGSAAVIYGKGRIGARRLLLVGMGKKEKVNVDKIRSAAAIAAGKAVDLKAATVALALHFEVGKKFNLEAIGEAITEGAFFGAYRYDEYITKSENGRLSSLKIEIIEPDTKAVKELSKGAAVGSVIGQTQNFARTIANRPANVVNPAKLAEEARKMARANGLSCLVFDEKGLEAKKMGGILAVGSGSASKPRLIVLKYTPRGAKSEKLPTIGIVGKAITFDSGGISIKPSNGMQDMKFDKSGGIAVLATMKAIAELKPAVNVYGIIPSAENLPSGTSYRPGDIVTTFSGKTVEIENTDAEGRMVLCDGIHYAVTQKCDTIIDIATLTGACMVALGKFKAGLMGSDDRLIEELKAASEASGEKVWHLPCDEEYLEEMKSDIADLKNSGGRWGGACTAAAFLKEFTGDKKWAHIDMAGVDLFEKSQKGGSVGATGFGVRLLTTYILKAAK